MAFSVSYIYELVDRYSDKLRKITAGTKKFEDRIKKAGKSLKKFGAKTRALGRRMSSFWLTAAAAAAFILPIKAAVQFEDKMADVKKTVNEIKTPKQLKEMKDIIFGLSKKLGIMPGDMASLAAAAGKMGIPIKDMRVFLTLAGSAAVAFDMSADQAGTVIGKIKTQYKLSLEGTKNLLDAVNFLSDNTIATAEDVLNVLTRMQGQFNALRFPPEVAAGWSAAAIALTKSPELAASGMEQIITNIQAAKDALPNLNKAILKGGKTAANALLSHFKKLGAMKPEKLMEEITKIYGAGPGAKLARVFANNLGELERVLKLVGDKEKYAGSMGKELATKMDTVGFKIKQATAAFKIASLTLGESLLPALDNILEFLTPLIEKMGAWAKEYPNLAKWTMILVGALAILMPIIIAVGFTISAIGVIFSKIGLIVMGVIAGIVVYIFHLIEVFYFWRKATKDILKTVEKLWKDLQKELKEVWDDFTTDIRSLTNFFESMGKAIMRWVDPLIEKLDNIIEKVKKIKETWIGKAIGALATGVSIVTDPVKAFADLESGKSSAMPTPRSAIDGQINIKVSGEGKVESWRLSTDVGGNLGFNMMPQ